MTTRRPTVPSPTLAALLAGLRRRIRRYVGWVGAARLVAALGAIFWLTLVADRFLEPPAAVRAGILVIASALLVVVAVRRIVLPLMMPLRNSSLALLLERRFPQFQDRLLTVVELAARQVPAEEAHPELLARTEKQAEEAAATIDLGQVFNLGLLRQSMALAVAAVISVVGFGVFSPESLGIWGRRVLLLSDELWPRRTRLVVPGFEEGPRKVARGSDVEISVLADTSGEIPDVVEVRYRTAAGLRDRKPMDRKGQADPQRDPYQEFTYRFRGVLAPVVFDVFGGDDVVRNLQIEVVDNPAIVEMWLDLEFPAYMARPPRTVRAAGLMQFPWGTRIRVRGRANKPLVRLAVETDPQEHPRPAQTLAPEAGDPARFQIGLPPLAGNTTLLFTLYDADGIKSREPVRLALSAAEDRPPEFSVRLEGIGSAITPQAMLPAKGRVSDDYGLAHVWFEYEVDGGKPARQPIAQFQQPAAEMEIAHALDVRPLGLHPGQKFQFSLKADDRFDLGPSPNTGQSERWVLNVVTPEQLRTMLEARELVLRQRFETVVEDVAATRDLVARIDFGSASPSASAAEPGDEAANNDRSPERLLAQRLFRVQSAQQNGRKAQSEVSGIARAFLDIRAELVNNRMDTAELQERLEAGIAVPLGRIADQMFPELDRRLQDLEAALANSQAKAQARDSALAQLDAILAAMRAVLSRMLELEDFNEVVQLLRDIIASQDKVRELTRQRHRSRILDLKE